MASIGSATPVQAASATVGDAWSVLILREALLMGTRRFVDFHDALQLNRATLTSRLGLLAESGLLDRRGDKGTDRPAYLPTERSLEYVGVLLSMLEWGRRWESDPSEGRLLDVTHRSCGAILSTVMTCAVCRGPVNARSVDAERPAADLRRPPSMSKMRLPRLDQLERGHRCPIARCLVGAGDRWSVLIIQEAFFGLRNFDAFINRLGIAPNILSQRLGHLCDRGILAQRPASNGSGRHHYRLTEKGLDLYRVPATQRQWAMRSLGVTDPLGVTHRWCGHDLDIVLRCAHCGDPIEPRAVDAAWPERSSARPQPQG